ncbi:MAG TPA: glycosyltransferase family 1 protein [candidate division Zixibacteria bacterium]|nr:glycosyltransferase family 1 protein [candidate division Zixibacteria bacterium]
MNILVHSIYFPPEVGGLETHVWTLIKALQNKGHSIRVVTSRSGDFPKNETIEGIEVERRFCPNKKFTGWVITTLAGISAMKKHYPWADICHVHTFPSIIPAIPLRRRGIPLVATIHTSHFLRLAKKRFWRPILSYLLSKPDIILAPSIEIRDVCRELSPNTPAYAMVNAADTDLFKPIEPLIKRPSPSTKIVAVPRRLFVKNGVEYIVRALPLILLEHDVQLYLLGDGPLRDDLEKLCTELGIEQNVHFMGAQPHENMPALISSADVIVIPSLMEATSVAGLEAMACERPIVASRVGGLPEIIDEETGELVPPRDPTALAQAVCRLLSLPEEKIRQMGKSARAKVVDNWSVPALAEQVLAFYEEAVSRAKKRMERQN